MLGFLFKDIKINRSNLFIVLTVVLVFCTFPVFVSADGWSEIVSGESSRVYCFIYFFMFGTAFLVVGMMASNLQSGDERKKWGYYTASVPGGIRKQVGSCYILILCSVIFTLGATVLANFLTRKLISDSVPDVSQMMVLIALVVLFFRAVELPFFFAFGSKTGSFVKTLMVIVLVFCVGVYFMFADLSWMGNGDSVWESIFDLIENMDIKHIMEAGPAGKLVLLAVPGYVVSYLISTKVYLKGVEHYIK